MNIALSAVLIFILLIPPIAFYLSYSFGNFSKSGPKFSLLDGILASAIISLFVHGIAILIINQEIRFDILLKLVGGEIKDVEKKITNAEFTKSIKQFALYNFIILVLFIALGRVCRWFVIAGNRHVQGNELFRLNNRWWYLFNGLENGIEDFDLVLIDAVVDTKDGTIIYSGFLVNYVCNGEELDRIYLRDVVRREFKVVKDDILKTGEPASIPGETFSIPYNNIINLNLKFLTITDDLESLKDLPDSENLNTEEDKTH